MKTNITPLTTQSNTLWIQRGAVTLLLLAVLTFAIVLAVRPNTHAAAPIPSAQQSGLVDVSNPNNPIVGTGSAYDGGSYVTKQPTVSNPNNPIVGTGSAYDGQ